MELLEFAKRLRKQSAQRGLTPASSFGAKTLAGIGLFLLAAVLPLRADIIVSVTGTSIGSGSSLGGPFSQVLASSWSSVNAYSDVAVSAELGTFDPTTTGTAFLMDRIGPGATTANQIAAASYTVNSPISTLVPLFTGLGLLPGSYFLVLTGVVLENSDLTDIVGLDRSP